MELSVQYEPDSASVVNGKGKIGRGILSHFLLQGGGGHLGHTLGLLLALQQQIQDGSQQEADEGA